MAEKGKKKQGLRKKEKNAGGHGVSAHMDFENLLGSFYDQIRMLHLGYTILLGFGFAGSFIIWWYVFAGMKVVSVKVLIVEAVVHSALFLAYLYRILYIGYDDRLWRNFRNTWFAGTLMSMAGFAITGISFIGIPDETVSGGMFAFMGVISMLFASMVLTLLPALIVSVIIWFIVAVSEFFTG